MRFIKFTLHQHRGPKQKARISTGQQKHPDVALLTRAHQGQTAVTTPEILPSLSFIREAPVYRKLYDAGTYVCLFVKNKNETKSAFEISIGSLADVKTTANEKPPEREREKKSVPFLPTCLLVQAAYRRNSATERVGGEEKQGERIIRKFWRKTRFLPSESRRRTERLGRSRSSVIPRGKDLSGERWGQGGVGTRGCQQDLSAPKSVSVSPGSYPPGIFPPRAIFVPPNSVSWRG